MSFYKTSRMKYAGLRRALLLVLLALLAVMLTFSIRNRTFSHTVPYSIHEAGHGHGYYIPASEVGGDPVVLDANFKPKLPKKTDLSIRLEHRNRLPPRNLDLFPHLAKDHIKIVLYVHNRPRYLQVVVQSLSKVEGIGETLRIVSHDGYFEEMDKIVQSIKFCQVKQIFAPYSPHLFPDGFPGASPGDCRGKDDPVEKKCKGNADQYGNHRSPKFVSLKHHWWWMMNAVWGTAWKRQRDSLVILCL